MIEVPEEQPRSRFFMVLVALLLLCVLLFFFSFCY